MFRRSEKRVGAGLLLLAALLMFVCPAEGQDSRKVPISFLPPPLETATYSLGIYDAKSGKLVRRLQEGATASAFTVGDNGLITNWDGKDDAGKVVAPGKYAARGYAVGALKVEGVDMMGNDWAKDDETLQVRRVEAIALIPEDEGLAVVVNHWTKGYELLRVAGKDSKILWCEPVFHGPMGGSYPSDAFPLITLQIESENLVANCLGYLVKYHISDGQFDRFPEKFAAFHEEFAAVSIGKDNTTWKIEEGGVSQYSSQGEKLRHLNPQTGEPPCVSVSASTRSDRFYVLERDEKWQRVRGLYWVETKQEDGKQVSTWQTFFERNIRAPDPALGLESPATPVEISLVENPLDPGKSQKITLAASHDDKGSYLTTVDGLRLRQISQSASVIETKLKKDKTTNRLAFFQNDAPTWDEFSIEGAKNMMEFDAGEFEMTADGEKTHPEKAAEPPDL